jgi:septal ring factor EnvC (AmiA/AmiB activator)
MTTFPQLLRTWFNDAETTAGDTFARVEEIAGHDIGIVETFIHTEEEKVHAMITDAISALNAAKDAVLAKIANDANALAGAQSQLTQAQTDRDAAQAQVTQLQGQLADAENQINAITAQLNPPAPAA